MNMTTRLDGDTDSVNNLGLSDLVADLEVIFENQDTTVDGITYLVEAVDASAGTARLVIGDSRERERWFAIALTEIPVPREGDDD